MLRGGRESVEGRREGVGRGKVSRGREGVGGGRQLECWEGGFWEGGS